MIFMNFYEGMCIFGFFEFLINQFEFVCLRSKNRMTVCLWIFAIPNNNIYIYINR